MVWVSLGLINLGNFHIPPAINLGSLHRICGKGIHIHQIMDSYRRHMCHDHRRNSGNRWLGIGICSDDEAFDIISKGHISPHITSFPCNELRTSFICIRVVVNLFISRRLLSLKCLIGYLLRCSLRRLGFILLRRQNIDLLTIRMKGLRWHLEFIQCPWLILQLLTCRILWWPLTYRFPGWLLKKLVIRVWIASWRSL